MLRIVPSTSDDMWQTARSKASAIPSAMSLPREEGRAESGEIKPQPGRGRAGTLGTTTPSAHMSATTWTSPGRAGAAGSYPSHPSFIRGQS